MRAIAATVSVAHSTLLIIMSSESERALKMKVLIRMRKPVMATKPMIVPIIPKKPIMPKFSKNKDLRRLYPAEKIIGGRIMAKKSSSENLISFPMP